MRLLLVEDEKKVAAFVVRGLEAERFAVDVYVRHLRNKVDEGHERKLIRTVRGVGYAISDEGQI